MKQSALTRRGDRLTSLRMVPMMRAADAVQRITTLDPLWVQAFAIRPRSMDDRSHVGFRCFNR